MTRAPRDKMVYAPMHSLDWLTSTTVSLMPLAAQGAYVRLLMTQWTNSPHGLPVDEIELRDLTGARGAEWRRWGDKILAQFPIVATEHDHALTSRVTGPSHEHSRGTQIRRNGRMHDEWCAATQRREIYRKSGATGGLAKSQRAQEEAQQVDITPSGARATLEQRCSGEGSKSVDGIHYTTTDVVVRTASSDATTTTTHKNDSGDRHSEVMRVLALLPDPAHRSVVNAYLDSRPAARRLAFVATLDAMASGLGGSRGKSATWFQIGVGVVDAITTISGDITAQALRAFVAKAPPHAVAVVVEHPRVDDAHDDPRSISDANGHVVWHEGMPDHLRPDPRHD